MRRSELVALLLVGVAAASLVDGLRASVGLEFWHLIGASQDVKEVFITRVLLDLMVMSTLFVLGPSILGLLLSELLPRDDGGTSVLGRRESADHSGSVRIDTSEES